MRVALLQTRIRTDSRSANLSHVLRQVVRAAEAVPAPDLVMLPAGCDGPVSEGLSPAIVQGFAESLAAMAREWGVYVAAGLLRWGGDGFGEEARVYDPDGDALIGTGPGERETVFTVRDTPLGRLGIGLDSDDARLAPPAVPCDVLLVHGRWTAPPEHGGRAGTDVHARLAELARQARTPVCAVGLVGRGCDRAAFVGGSGLWASGGRCVLAADVGEETTLFGEVPDRPKKALNV